MLATVPVDGDRGAIKPLFYSVTVMYVETTIKGEYLVIKQGEL